MVDYTTVFAGVAIVVGVVNLILYYTQVIAGKPKIDFRVSSGNYAAIGVSKGKESKVGVRVTCAIMFRNSGNASGSVNDIMLRTRYTPDLRGHPLGQKLLGSGSQALGRRLKEAGLLSGRPTNFGESIPIHVEPYGTSKATFVFEFADAYPYYLDRAITPMDPGHKEDRTGWEDLAIYVELTVATTNGVLDQTAFLWRDDQPESKRHSGFMSSWESMKKDIKIVHLEEKNSENQRGYPDGGADGSDSHSGVK